MDANASRRCSTHQRLFVPQNEPPTATQDIEDQLAQLIHHNIYFPICCRATPSLDALVRADLSEEFVAFGNDKSAVNSWLSAMEDTRCNANAADFT